MKYDKPKMVSLPSIFFDYWMNRIPFSEFKILMCIAYKTYNFSFSEEAVGISSSEMVKYTGLSRSTIKIARDGLASKRMLIVEYKKDNNKFLSNKYYLTPEVFNIERSLSEREPHN